jgi:hypothetical protein
MAVSFCEEKQGPLLGRCFKDLFKDIVFDPTNIKFKKAQNVGAV